MQGSRSGTPKPRTFQDPPLLRLPDDVLALVLQQLEGNLWEGFSTIKDLKSLCLVHRHFLEPVRAILYHEPASLNQDKKRLHADLQALASSLASSGLHIKHLPYLGEQLDILYEQQIAPSIVSQLAIRILCQTPNLRSLSVPRVELRDQEKLVQAITAMRGLQQIKLGVGCARSKDGTPTWHEGDLRRIASACSELEEAHAETANIHFAPTSGWVEPFAFKSLRTLTLRRATSFGDNHLLAIVTQAKQLVHLNLVGCLNRSETNDDKPRLSRTGIAEVLARCGGRLKSFALDDSNLHMTPKDDDGSIPQIEAALLHCTVLETLSLAGPGVVRPEFLLKLGRPPSPPPLSSYRMPPPPGTTTAPALQHVSTLCLGIRPTPQKDLLDFVKALPLSASTPISALTDTVFPALKLFIINECTTRSHRRDEDIDQRLAWLGDLREAGVGKRARVVLKESLDVDMPWAPRSTATAQMDAPKMRNRGFLSGPWLPDVKPLLPSNADNSRFSYRTLTRARALPVAPPTVQPPPGQLVTRFAVLVPQPQAVTPSQAAAQAAMARAQAAAALQQQQPALTTTTATTADTTGDASQSVVGASAVVQGSQAEHGGESTEQHGEAT